MIGVGIMQNIFISAVTIDDKGVLEITFKENTPEAKMNVFEAMQSGEAIDTSAFEKTIKLFAPMEPFEKDSKGNPLSQEKRSATVQRELVERLGILIHILKGYTTSESYSLIGKNSFAGLDVNKDNYEAEILKKEVFLAIQKNRCRVFIEEITPFLNDDKLLFRLLLVRQGKDKHFATFRTKNLEDNPFWESMSIPEAASKVHFTPQELKDGLNDGTPSQRSDAADKPTDKPGATGSGSTGVNAATIFG